jgi:hypothetical protein
MTAQDVKSFDQWLRNNAVIGSVVALGLVVIAVFGLARSESNATRLSASANVANSAGASATPK